MSSIFFTSDSHFGHNNVIKYCNRPFSSIGEMDEKLISEWNNTVSKNDTVYHLGDFTFGDHKPYLNRLNGKNKYLILGNHDRIDRAKNAGWDNIYDLCEVRDDNKNRFILCHYAMRVWNGSHKGNYHLYGHSHANLDELHEWGRSMDVGVDNIARLLGRYRPIEITEVFNLLKDREYKMHHPK